MPAHIKIKVAGAADDQDVDPAVDMVLCSAPKEVTSHDSSQVLFSSSDSCRHDGPRLNLPDLLRA